MPRSRKIHRNPSPDKNYYVVDASFLVNKYILLNKTPDARQKTRVGKCLEWWTEINNQIRVHRARVYVADICIAETFKVLAQKYYADKWLSAYEVFHKAGQKSPRWITQNTRFTYGL